MRGAAKGSTDSAERQGEQRPVGRLPGDNARTLIQKHLGIRCRARSLTLSRELMKEVAMMRRLGPRPGRGASESVGRFVFGVAGGCEQSAQPTTASMSASLRAAMSKNPVSEPTVTSTLSWRRSTVPTAQHRHHIVPLDVVAGGVLEDLA